MCHIILSDVSYNFYHNLWPCRSMDRTQPCEGWDPGSTPGSVKFTTKIMSYQHEHIPMYDGETWFNLLAKSFFLYHKKFSSKEQNHYQKYFPRSFLWKRILDLGAGDGRIAKNFSGSWFESYYSVDIAEKILNNGPSRTTKILADISKPLLLDIHSFDLIFLFHTLVYIDEISGVFVNIAQYLDHRWICIIAHHHERRPSVYQVNGQSFKITTYFHSDQKIFQNAASVGLTCLQHSVDDTCFFILRHEWDQW